MKRFIFISSMIFLLSGCSDRSEDLQEVKDSYGDFGRATLKWRLSEFAGSPIEKKIKHHPEDYKYLEGLDVFSIAHLSDGNFITGFMVTPKGPGKYPCIVFNRGGNKDVGQLYLGTAVDVMAPIAAAGYVVVASNYRGNSRGEGINEFGGSDVRDVINLMRSLGEFDKADTSRIGMVGISRGGMMNMLSLKETDRPGISAIANVGGIVDLETTVTHHEEIEHVLAELIPNYSANRDEEVKRRSAIQWVHGLPVSTPLLILHSDSDDHVHYGQIIPFADSLDQYKIPYKLVTYKNDTHGLSEHRNEVMSEVIAWFDLYVKDSNGFEGSSNRVVVK